MLDFLLRPKNDSMLQNISDHMSKIKAIPLIMERMKRGACKASDWMALYRVRHEQIYRWLAHLFSFAFMRNGLKPCFRARASRRRAR